MIQSRLTKDQASNPNLDPADEELILAPQRLWQSQALKDVAAQASSEATVRDIGRLVRGRAYTSSERSLVTEYVAELSDARIQRLVDKANDPTFQGSVDVGRAFLVAIEEAKGRKSFAKILPELEKLSFRLQVISAPSMKGSKELLAAAPGPEGSSSQTLAEAFRTPQGDADYAELFDFYSFVKRYRSREVPAIILAGTLARLKSDGLAAFDPAANAGSPSPLIAAAIVCVEFRRDAETVASLVAMAESASIDTESRNRVIFLGGMERLGVNDYETGIAYFDKIIVGDGADYYTGAALVRKASALQSLHKPFDAAVLYLQAMEDFQKYPSVLAEATASYENLLQGGKLTRQSVQAGLQQLRQGRTASVAMKITGEGK